MNKICNKCNAEKDISKFHKLKVSKDGYRNICRICFNKQKLDSDKQYRERNKEKISGKHKEYYLINRDDLLEKKHIREKLKGSDFNKMEYIKRKEKNKEYRKHNKEKLNEYKRNKYATDPLYRLASVYRSNTYKAFKHKGYKKYSKTEYLLGCSYSEFITHIENQFKDWMTYDNFGLYEINKYNYGWDIDHIKPLSHASTEEELIKLCHYTNLQPLCSKVNRDIKKDNY